MKGLPPESLSVFKVEEDVVDWFDTHGPGSDDNSGLDVGILEVGIDGTGHGKREIGRPKAHGVDAAGAHYRSYFLEAFGRFDDGDEPLPCLFVHPGEVLLGLRDDQRVEPVDGA